MKTNGGRGFSQKPILLLAFAFFLQLNYATANEIYKPRLVRAGGNYIPDSSVTGLKTVSLKNKVVSNSNTAVAKTTVAGMSSSESVVD